MRLRGIKAKGLNFKEGLNLTPLTVPTIIKKHKYGATATWSHNTDQYRPTVVGRGWEGEIYALKHNLQVTTYLNHVLSNPYVPQIQGALDGGRLSIGSYDLTAQNYETGELTDESYLDYLVEQTEWVKRNFGYYPTTASFSYGRQTFKDDLANYYLGTRNSGYSLNEYSYDIVDTSSLMSTTRHADMAGEWATVLGSCNTALQNAITEGGWYRDFAHWHSNAKIKEFFEAQSPIIHSNNVVTLGMGEALEYMKFRQSAQRAEVGTDGTQIYVSAVVSSSALNRKLIKTHLSVDVDLTGTAFEGKELSSSHGLQKIAPNKFIVEVPYGSHAVLSESYGDYLDFELPSVISTENNTVTTDKPTKLSIWQVPLNGSLDQAQLVSRDNNLSLSHEFGLLDKTTSDYYFGLITQEQQSILVKY